MDMDDNSSDMDMSDDMDMGMSMVMTFTSWSDYQLKIVWDGWDVKTEWQFALSWFAVMFMTFAYQGLKHQHTYLEAQIMSLRMKRSDSGDDKGSSSAETPTVSGTSRAPLVEKLIDTVVGGSNEIPFKYVLLHAFLGSVNYALALILMLVAMTYNPSLFMALVVGYFLGDIFFFRRSLMPKLGQYEAVNTRYGVAGNDCH